MKKVMVALTGLVSVATIGASVPAITPATTAQAAYVSPSLKVDSLYNNEKTISGTATKGSKITVKASKNAKKNLASGTASAKTGKYSVKLSKTLSKNSDVYVYATNPKTKAYFYRIVRVQAAAAKKTTTSKKPLRRKLLLKRLPLRRQLVARRAVALL